MGLFTNLLARVRRRGGLAGLAVARATGAASSRREAEEFAYFGQRLFPNSTAVADSHYDGVAKVLTIRFVKGVKDYDFPGISPEEAEDFARAPSKGGWLWDNGLLKAGQRG